MRPPASLEDRDSAATICADILYGRGGVSGEPRIERTGREPLICRVYDGDGRVGRRSTPSGTKAIANLRYSRFRGIPS
jgi:hypothetical protein